MEPSSLEAERRSMSIGQDAFASEKIVIDEIAACGNDDPPTRWHADPFDRMLIAQAHAEKRTPASSMRLLSRCALNKTTKEQAFRARPAAWDHGGRLARISHTL